MNFLKALLASVALIAATSAHADVTNIGTLTNTYDQSKVVGPNTSFNDFYNFVLVGNAAEFSASKLVLTNSAGDRYNFSSLILSVFSGVYGDSTPDVLLHQAAVGSTQADFTLGSLLNNSSYYVQVQGVTSGASGGIYSFSITPVPEPSSVAMLLVGFAALGAVARRRKSL